MHHVHRLVDSDGSNAVARARHSVACRRSTPNKSMPKMTFPSKRHVGRRLACLFGRAGSCTRLSGAIQDNASIDRCMPRVDAQHVDAQHDDINLLVLLGVCLGVYLNDVESVRHAPDSVPKCARDVWCSRQGDSDTRSVAPVRAKTTRTADAMCAKAGPARQPIAGLLLSALL